MKKILIVLLLAGISVRAETIYTFWNSDPANPSDLAALGWSPNYRIAQVFIAPPTDNVLRSFSFQAYGKDTSQFTATLWSWNPSSSSLISRFNSSNYEWWGVLNHGNNFVTQQKFTFSGFEYQLTPGESYALVFQGYGTGMLNWMHWDNPSTSSIGSMWLQTDANNNSAYSDFGTRQSLTQLSFVPEPSSLSLLLAGGMVLITRRRRTI